MHSPSRSRAILRALKSGADPAALIPQAIAIPDPDHAARTLFLISSERGLPWDDARRAILKVAALVPQVEKPSRAAELAVELLRKLPAWREGGRNPETQPRRDHLRSICVDVITELPPGPWTSDALCAAATERAVFDRAVELDCVDAIRMAVREHPRWLRDIKNTRLRALCGDIEAVWQCDAETIRIVAWHPDTHPVLFAQSVPDDAALQVQAWTLAGARLDKEGKDGASWLAKAEARLPDVPEAQRAKLSRKLRVAMEKAGVADAPPRGPAKAPAEETSAEQAPVEESPTEALDVRPREGRNVLGLVDGYQGSLKPVHIRAVARAAPLCVAFDLDLGLYGFPTTDIEGLVRAAAAETNIGEGADYLQQLQDAGRIHHEVFPGTVVASTPHPDASKRAALPAGRVVMLMGLGRQGLPKRYLEGASVHYEITGKGVSLETATAMGILAERLR